MIFYLKHFSINVVGHKLSHIWLFVTAWTAAWQASLSFNFSLSLHKLMPIQLVMPSNHLILTPFSLCPQSFPASGSFPVSQLLASGDQNIGASASTSVLPINIRDWLPLRLTWSPYCPRDSQESSPAPQFKSISSSGLSLLYGQH